MKKKRILLTGASGSVGKKILEELYKKREEYNLTLFARGSIKNRKLFRPYHNGINVIWGDILEFEKCIKAVKKQDIIIHAAALIPPEAYKDPEYTHKVNVSGINNIIKAAKALNIQPRVIYTSSIAVYGDRLNNPIIKKQDKPNPNDIYGKTKVKA